MSHTNCHKGAECHSVIDGPKHIAHIVAIQQWLKQALEKEYVLISSCPICVQLARDLGILLVRAVVVHHEVHVASHQSFVDMCCPAEKSHHLPVEEMAVAHGYCTL